MHPTSLIPSFLWKLGFLVGQLLKQWTACLELYWSVDCHYQVKHCLLWKKKPFAVWISLPCIVWCLCSLTFNLQTGTSSKGKLVLLIHLDWDWASFKNNNNKKRGLLYNTLSKHSPVLLWEDHGYSILGNAKEMKRLQCSWPAAIYSIGKDRRTSQETYTIFTRIARWNNCYVYMHTLKMNCSGN